MNYVLNLCRGVLVTAEGGKVVGFEFIYTWSDLPFYYSSFSHQNQLILQLLLFDFF